MPVVANMRFLFNCRDSFMSEARARLLVEPVGRILHHERKLNHVFLVATTQKKADAFAATHPQWKVFPETNVSTLPTRPTPIKPPSQD
jgi:hypothetical protein